MNTKIKIALGSLLAILSFNSIAATVVIGSKELSPISTDKEVKKLFLGKKTEINGVTVTPIDLKEGSKTRTSFYNNIVGQTEDEVKSYRTEMTFTGKGTPPKEVVDEKSLKALVTTTPGTIGYIDDSLVDDSVKVIFSIK
jgi:ABC-type phosphate transport system substrate-binding protein